jgi:hypothetical protein
MAQITRAYITEMGETGAGIQNAAEIDTTQLNAFTNKWGTYLSFMSVPSLMLSQAEISSYCPEVQPHCGAPKPHPHWAWPRQYCRECRDHHAHWAHSGIVDSGGQ